jgi:hypothetical protein
MVIAPRDTVDLHVSYQVSLPTNADGGWETMGFAYMTRPAALWAGTVGQADFVFELMDDAWLLSCKSRYEPPYADIEIEPKGYTVDGNQVIWHYEDWEPDKDISFIARKAMLDWDLDCLWSPTGPDDYFGRALLLPPYVADRHLLDPDSILALSGSAYRGGAPVLPNYATVVQCFLQALSMEIEVRHGAKLESALWHRFFAAQPWYSAIKDQTQSDLSDLERKNKVIIRELIDRIEADPSLAMPPWAKSED